MLKNFNLYSKNIRNAFLVCILILLGTDLSSQQLKDTSLTIFFKTGVYSLDSIQKRDLAQFALSANVILGVVGYADTVGSLAFNKRLSRLRAIEVQKFLSNYRPIGNVPAFKGEEFYQDNDQWKNRKVDIFGMKSLGITPTLPEGLDSVIKSFDLENIHFIPDKAIVTPESMQVIPALVKILHYYRDANFIVIGHVNYQSRRDSTHLGDLFRLSEDRAKLVMQILIDNGIDKERISFRGVGNSQPLIKDPGNDEERKRNMRVQMLIIK